MVPWPPQVIAEDHHTSLQPSGQPAAKKQAEGHGESSHHGAVLVKTRSYQILGRVAARDNPDVGRLDPVVLLLIRVPFHKHIHEDLTLWASLESRTIYIALFLDCARWRGRTLKKYYCRDGTH